MNPSSLSLSSATTTSPFPVSPHSITSIAVDFTSAGTLTYSVEYTNDDVFASGYSPGSGTWVTCPEFSSLTTAKSAQLTYSVKAVRLKVSSYSSGTVRMTVYQQPSSEYSNAQIAVAAAEGVGARVLDVISDGSTDQTSEIVAQLDALDANGFRGAVIIPDGTKFTALDVLEAVPLGVAVMVRDANWGQPPSYKTTHRAIMVGEAVDDDQPQTIMSDHHPAMILANFGRSGTVSAQKRLATLIQGINRTASGDIAVGLMFQMGKAAGDAWSARVVTYRTYLIGLANPAAYAAGVTYVTHNAATPEVPLTMCVSDGGKIYKCVSGGVSSGSGPTGTGTGIVTGGCTWDYLAAAADAQATVWSIDETGNMIISSASGTNTFTQASGSYSHAFWQGADGTTTWRDVTRGRNNFTVTTAEGFRQSAPGSLHFYTVSGATPSMVTPALYVSNGSATNMTNIVLPTSQTSGIVTLMFANANTTLKDYTASGGSFWLKGSVDVTPPSGGIMQLVKHSTHSSIWFEMSRSW